MSTTVGAIVSDDVEVKSGDGVRFRRGLLVMTG